VGAGVGAAAALGLGGVVADLLLAAAAPLLGLLLLLR